MATDQFCARAQQGVENCHAGRSTRNLALSRNPHMESPHESIHPVDALALLAADADECVRYRLLRIHRCLTTCYATLPQIPTQYPTQPRSQRTRPTPVDALAASTLEIDMRR